MNDSPAVRGSSRNSNEALGQLRESLSALKNLQQLLASIHAGPKLLAGLLPEVQSAAERVGVTSAALLDRVARLDRLASASSEGQGPTAASLAPLRAFAEETTRRLEQMLEGAAQGPLLAKRRLTLEAAIKEMLPSLTGLLEHLELLSDAADGVSVSLPLAELLSSRPSHGSSRPVHEVLVIGPAEDLAVLLPPRAGLGAFALLLEAPELGPRPTLTVQEAGERVTLWLGPLGQPAAEARAPRLDQRLICHVPSIHRIPPSGSTARLILQIFGAEWSPDEPARFSLPARHSGNDTTD